MTQAEAKLKVEEHLNRNFDPNPNGRLVVIDARTISKPYGWVFFLSTERFLRTRDRRCMPIGLGAIVFDIGDNSIHCLPTSRASEEEIAAYEQKRKSE